MSRYARQMILPEVGADGQVALATAHVLVIGAGGLAASALPLLAGAGVGRITIVDCDTVELSNLHRQTMFIEADQGQPKAEVAAARCAAINGEIAVEAVVAKLTPANAPALLDDVTLVMDCADSYAVSYTLSDLCLAQNIPLITGSALALSGYAAGVCGGAPSLRALFPEAPESGASCATAGVMGPVVALIGAMQAQMALATLMGQEPSPLGQMVQFDAKTMRSAPFRFDAAPEPETAFSFVSLEMLGKGDTIVELRGIEEAPEPSHPDALRLLPDQLKDELPIAEGRLALCCATGLRSWRAAEQIQKDWPGEIVLVAASAS
ncbi:HesA/MoeB/ThiF family protein [Shimia sagamensis]|uniref:Molybdopterin or thiamine biosynthesis adenylyltransferase n=1 Tax=Shimia sagamensis TaxID=1566352 RepID=A0ABY1N7B7_9RHOB|nr:HesA/MoeB/ThiF family protein [Shimia sagamensis]SMP01952.1 Molybdopterin or thiamine biosynthesis adenylyltransferase [Shimia sagamensis]